MSRNEESEEFIKEVIPLLKISASHLDNALPNVTNRATKDLAQLKE